jgi:hypothetical protein
MVEQFTSVLDSVYSTTPSIVSNCCGARLLGESDICSECKEHSDPMEYEAWFGTEQPKEDVDENVMEK